MKRTFLIGLAAVAIGGIGIWLGGVLGMEFSNTIMGVGGGVILAMVNDRSPLARLGGFLMGYLLGVFFTAMILGLVPGGRTVIGMAIAFLILLIPITLIAGLSSSRIPEWTMLLGVLVFVAGFAPDALASPWTAGEALMPAFFSQLAMAALGFLVVIVVELLPEKSKDESDSGKGDASDETNTSTESTTSEQTTGGTK
jgi:hypothetical protein